MRSSVGGRYHADVTRLATPLPSGRGRARSLAPALAAAVVGAGVLFLLAGPLGVTSGLLVVTAAVGWITGLAVRVGVGGRTPGRRVGAAVGLALAACILAWGATWGWSRVQGGALGPRDLLAQAYGMLIPAQAAFAALGAALGAR